MQGVKDLTSYMDCFTRFRNQSFSRVGKALNFYSLRFVMWIAFSLFSLFVFLQFTFCDVDRF